MNEYASWYTEIHPYEVGLEVTREITRSLAVRITLGSAVIVCDRPRNLHSAFIKRWKKLLRALENDRAATSNRAMKAELKTFSSTLESTQFLFGKPEEVTRPTVWLIEPDDFDTVPFGVMTIYVMSELTQEQMIFWSRQMKDESAVIIFRKTPLNLAARPKK